MKTLNQASYKRKISIITNIYYKIRDKEDLLYAFGSGVLFGAILMIYLTTGSQ